MRGTRRVLEALAWGLALGLAFQWLGGEPMERSPALAYKVFMFSLVAMLLQMAHSYRRYYD